MISFLIKSLKNIAQHIAGTSTTFRATHALVAILTNSPELQKRLQREVDNAIGEETPRLADKEKMPYTEAVRFEIFTHLNYFFYVFSLTLASLWGIPRLPTFSQDPAAMRVVVNYKPCDIYLHCSHFCFYYRQFMSCCDTSVMHLYWYHMPLWKTQLWVVIQYQRELRWVMSSSFHMPSQLHNRKRPNTYHRTTHSLR